MTTRVRKAFNDLVAAGLLVPNGKFRPGRDGKLEPVFVAIDLPWDEVERRLRLLKPDPDEPGVPIKQALAALRALRDGPWGSKR
jgi:hypothetical protein